MKTILCYGDSNTHGTIPGDDLNRFPYHQRWTGIMARQLGNEYLVVEEGLSGRTTVFEDPIEPHRNGRPYLMPCLMSHQPIDLVVLMLGTNDTKVRFSAPAIDIATGAGLLVDIIQKSQTGFNMVAPQILLVAPPPLGKLTDYEEFFGVDSVAKSRKFGVYYRQIAEQYGCHFLDGGTLLSASDKDGVHYELDVHARFGNAMAELIKSLLE
jgi:lysophospholipase L1-like esterase